MSSDSSSDDGRNSPGPNLDEYEYDDLTAPTEDLERPQHPLKEHHHSHDKGVAAEEDHDQLGGDPPTITESTASYDDGDYSPTSVVNGVVREDDDDDDDVHDDVHHDVHDDEDYRGSDCGSSRQSSYCGRDDDDDGDQAGGEGSLPPGKLQGNAAALEELFSNICEMREMISGRRRSSLASGSGDADIGDEMRSRQKMQMDQHSGSPVHRRESIRLAVKRRSSIGGASVGGASLAASAAGSHRRNYRQDDDDDNDDAASTDTGGEIGRVIKEGRRMEAAQHGHRSSSGDASVASESTGATGADLSPLYQDEMYPNNSAAAAPTPPSRPPLAPMIGDLRRDSESTAAGSSSTLGTSKTDTEGGNEVANGGVGGGGSGAEAGGDPLLQLQDAASSDADLDWDDFDNPAGAATGLWSAHLTGLFLRLSCALSDWNNSLLAEEEFILTSPHDFAEEDYEDESELLADQETMRQIITVHDEMLSHVQPATYELFSKVITVLMEHPPPAPSSDEGNANGSDASAAAATAAEDRARIIGRWAKQIGKQVEVLTKLVLFMSGYSIRMEVGGGGDQDRHETAFFTVFELLRMTVLTGCDGFLPKEEEERGEQDGLSESDREDVEGSRDEQQIGDSKTWKPSSKLRRSWKVFGYWKKLKRSSVVGKKDHGDSRNNETTSVLVDVTVLTNLVLEVLKATLSTQIVTFVDGRRSTYTIARCIRSTAWDLYTMCGQDYGGDAGMAAIPMEASRTISGVTIGFVAKRDREMNKLVHAALGNGTEASSSEPVSPETDLILVTPSPSIVNGGSEESNVSLSIGIGKTSLVAAFVTRDDVRLFYKGGVVWLGFEGERRSPESKKSLSYVSYCNHLQSICLQLDQYMYSDIPEFGRFVPQPDDDVNTREIKERHLMKKAKELVEEFIRQHRKKERKRRSKAVNPVAKSCSYGEQDCGTNGAQEDRILIVLDNLTNADDLEWFQFETEGKNQTDSLSCIHLIITTENAGFCIDDAANTAAAVVEVNSMDSGEAIELLVREAGHSSEPGSVSFDSIADAQQCIVRACKCHPLIVATAGRWVNLKQKYATGAEAEVWKEVASSVATLTESDQHSTIPLVFRILDAALLSCFKENFSRMIQLCLASLVFTFKDEERVSAGSPNNVSSRVAKLFWEAIFQGDLEECDDLLQDIKTFYGPQEREVFDAVLTALDDIGVIELVREQKPSSPDDPYAFIRLKHDVHKLYGHYLASGQREGFERITNNDEVRWNESLVEAYLDEKREGRDLIYDDSDDDYLLHMLPMHMLKADMLDDMEQILIDEDFVHRRLAILGCKNGAKVHVQDCKELHVHLQESGAKDEANATNSVVLIYEKLAVALGRIMAQGDDFESEKLILDVVQGMHEMGYSLFECKCLTQAYKYYKTSREILKYNSGGRRGEDELVAASRYSIGLIHMKGERYKKAMVHFEQALQAWEKRLGERTEFVAQIQYHMGTIHLRYGYYKKALANFEEALTIRRLFGHKAVATTLAKVGHVRHKCGDLDKALECYMEAMDLNEAMPGKKCLDQSDVLYSIANIRIQKGELSEAQGCIEEALGLKELTLDDENLVDIADAHQSMALVMHAKGDDDDALHSFMKSLRIYKMHYGDIHPKVGEAHHNLGSLYLDMEIYDEARSCLEQALRVRKKSLHASHVDVADTLHLVGMVKLKMGDRLNALPSFKETLRIRKAMLGNVHEKVAESLNTLGVFYNELGMHDKAVLYIEKELEMREELDGDTMKVIAGHEMLGDMEEGRGRYDEAIKHFQESLRFKKEALGEGEHLEVAETLFCLAKVNAKAENYEEAAENMQEALAIREHKLSQHDEVVVDTKHHMGVVLFKGGKHKQALECFESSLEGRKSIEEGDNDVAVAETLSGIGRVYGAMGLKEKAIDMFVEALRLKKKCLGDDHVELVPIITEMGNIFSSESDYDKALTLFEEAARLIDKEPVDKTLEIADMLSKMSIIYHTKRRLQDALHCGREALEIYQSILGERDVKVASCLHNLGSFLSVSGDYDQALDYFEQALQMRTILLGPTHADVSSSLYNASSVHNMMGDYEKALACLKEVLRIRKLGGNQASVVDVLQKIGGVYRESGEFAEAVKYYDEVLQSMKEDLGDNDINVAAVLHALGNLEDDRRNYDKAMEYFEESLKVRVVNLGLDHEDVATTLCSIAFVHGNRGNEGEAMQHLQEALRIRSFKLGPEHELVGDTHNNIAYFCCNMGKLDDAREHLWEALRIRKMNKSHHKVADTLNNLGNVHKELREFDMAIECYQEALNLRKTKLGMRDEDGIGDTYFNLGDLYVLHNDFDNATECYEESLRIRTLKLGKDHMKVADGHSNMVEVHLKRGEQNMALLRLEEVLRIKRLHLSENHEEVANTLYNMGIIYNSKRDWSNARKKFDDAMEVYEALGIGSENPRVAALMRSIATLEQRSKAPLSFLKRR